MRSPARPAPLLLAVLLLGCTPDAQGALSSVVERDGPTIEPAAVELERDPALYARAWRWTETTTADGGHVRPDEPSRYALDFGPEGSVAITADCNRAQGDVVTDGRGISVSIGPVTLAECPPGSRSTEFLAQVGQAEGYDLEGDRLLLRLRDGSAMAFRPTEAPDAPVAGQTGDLAGTSWRLVAVRFMNDTELRPGGAAFVLELRGDGTMALFTDCSTADGRWSSPTPGQLDFEGLSLRRDGCAPGSPGARTYDQLAWVRSYVFDRGHLYLATMADGSILELEPMPAP